MAASARQVSGRPCDEADTKPAAAPVPGLMKRTPSLLSDLPE
jgi:hypothetical protein